ncbi:DoxX family protein [Halorarum salinum]|uniref:DoxX family protein n=1 Tax=Halorarum salinum TaxID=2743089 RepID=A0A7D5QFJ1_9EURY|nr:DoxX family protein [Halobaculum salinum]QLG60724.1 DoxX family protein [Halobaculum salinum]
MAFEAAGTAEALLVGRVLFAAVLGYLALGNLRDRSGTVAYAGSEGAPVPRLTVPSTSLALLAGGAAILVGAYPVLGSLAIVAFMVGVTPVMHDFWNEEGMERDNQRFHFLKNAGLAAGAVVFLALSSTPWPYALNVGLW